MNELKAPQDVRIAIVDGLKGLTRARPLTRTLTRFRQCFRKPRCKTCVVHLIRHARAFVSYKDRKAVAASLKKIYKAKDADAGLAALDDFADGPWDRNTQPSLSPGGGPGRR